jgi:hypothetical protein
MKTPTTLLVLGLSAYGLWYYTSPNYSKVAVAAAPIAAAPARESAAASAVQATTTATTAAATEATEAAAVAPPAPAPDLERIALKKGAVLTHAKVRSIEASGILFYCDQGLLKIPFENLPEAFADYYKPMIAVASVPVDTITVTTAAPIAPPAPAPYVAPRAQKTALQDAQDSLAFTVSRNALKDRIRQDQDLITNWYRQSTFESTSISESQYTSAKADLDTATAQLGQLDANGPGS